MANDGAINIEFGGDNARAIRAMAELEQANEVLRKTLKDVQKDATEAGAKQERGAKQAAEAVERLKQRNKELDDRLKSVERQAESVNADYRKMIGEQATLQRSSDELIRQNERLASGMGKVGDAADKVAPRGRGAMELIATGARNAVGMLLGGAGVVGALGVVLKSLDDIEARAKGAKDAALTVEEAEAGIANNMASTGNAEQDAAATADAVAKGRDIAARRQVPVEMVQGAIAAGLSASGGDIEATLQAVDMQAELNRANPADITAGVEGQLNVARIMGTEDPAAAQGVLELIGQNSAIKDPSKISQNATPVLAAADAFGFDINEVGAFFSTLTQQTADPLGESSRTAAISFVEQLSAFFGEGAGKAKNDAAVRERGVGLGFGEMVGMLQEDAGLREEFQGGLSLEKRAVGPVKQLLEDAAGTFSTSMYEAMAKTPEDEAGLSALVDARRARLGAVPSVAVGDAQRGMDAAKQGSQINDVAAQTSGIFNSAELDSQLAAAGVQWVDRKIASVQMKGAMALGSSPEEAYRSTLTQQYQSFSEAEPDAMRNGLTGGSNGEIAARLASALEASTQASEKLATAMEKRGEQEQSFSKFFEGLEAKQAAAARTPIRNP